MTTIKFDKKLVCCTTYAAVRILDNGDEQKAGSIWLPESVKANGRLGFGIVESVGAEAAEEYGLAVGDYVLFDRLSTFAHTAPVAVLKCNNIICKTDAAKSKIVPLKNMLVVEPDKNDVTTNVDGVYVMGYAAKLNTGTVLSLDCPEDYPVKVGDKIVLSKGADNIDFGEKRVCIYKHDMVVAKVLEDV